MLKSFLISKLPVILLSKYVSFLLLQYKAEFVQGLLRKGENELAESFNYAFRYIDDVLSLNNKRFHNLFTPNISSGTCSQRYKIFVTQLPTLTFTSNMTLMEL